MANSSIQDRLNKALAQAKKDDQQGIVRDSLVALPDDIAEWKSNLSSTPSSQRDNRWSPLIGNYSTNSASDLARLNAAKNQASMGAQERLASNPFNSLLPGFNQTSLPDSQKPLVLDTNAPSVTPSKPVTWRDSSAAQQQAQTVQEEKYDGVLGFLRGVGESAISGIRSANEAIAGWLSDATPDFIKQETEANLVNIDADAARAAANAATGAVQAAYGKDGQSRAEGAQRVNQASDYLSSRAEEIRTGADTERLYQEAANSQEEAAQIREYAVGDSGAIAKLLFDAGVGGVQLLYDAGINALLPGAGLWSAAARGAGSGILEAQQSGANLLQQLAYGLGVGAVEAATEKISNLAGPLKNVFGSGVADQAVNRLISRLTSSTAGKALLQLAASAAGEGFEEFVSSAANPALRLIFDENAMREYADPQMWADAAYDALVGATIGGIVALPGSVTSIRRGADSTTDVQPAEAPTMSSAPAQSETGVDTQSTAGADTAQPSAQEAATNAVPQTNVQEQVAQLLSQPVTNSIANRIIESPELLAAFEAQTGLTVEGTKSQQRAIIKQAAERMQAQTSTQPEMTVAEQPAQQVDPTEGNAFLETVNAVNAQNAPQVQPQATNTVQPTDSLGAAPAGFDTFSAALEQFGEMPERGTGAREVSIPRSMDGETVIPRTVQTAANSPATPETAYTDITRLIEQGNFNRAVISDRASLGRAEATITDKGFQRALADWTAEVRSGRVSKDTTTLGLTLYNNAINSGDVQTGIQILVDIVDNARAGAQATQAMNILNKLSPEGRLYGIQRSVANLQEEIQRRLGDGAPRITINEDLANDYINAPDEQSRFEALNEIYRDVANQIPQNWYDKINAWRYFAMLANPRTHVRNLVGNTAMFGLTGIRNRLSSAIQSAVISDRSQRTRQTASRRNANDRALYEAGMQEYQRVSDMLMDAGKYTNQLGRIRRYMKAPFKGALGKAVDLSSNLLEGEDLLFSQRAYASNLTQFLKARGITAEQYISGELGQELTAEAQAYAIREAQRATFRDFNAFSNFVQRVANLGGDTKAGRIWQTIVGANMPFTRTPANIVVRGVEYSPIGLARGLTNYFTAVKRGEITAGEAIDQISSGLVGTALVGFGALLASQGIVSGGGSDDDNQAAFDELRGFQPYSINIGGRSYTLDWLAPAALPFFTGAEIWNQIAGKGSQDDDASALEAVLQGLGHMTDPMLEMSMLSGISDLLDSVAYYQGTNSIWPVLSSSVTNYISQFFPSIFGAIERTIEDTRQSSYTDPNSAIPDDLQYPISQVLNRFPGEYNQVDYIDAWGRTESTGSLPERVASNFISPGYISELSTSDVEDELQRIYDATGGEYNVFPDRATMGNTTVGGERLTPEQYTKYATTVGQTRLAEVSALMDSDAYQAMSDVERAKAIEEIYDYAAQTAKHEIDPSYDVDSKFEKAQEFGNAADFLAIREAWQTAQDTKGDDSASFIAAMQDYSQMSEGKQEQLKTLLGDGERFDDLVDAYEAGISPKDWYTAYDEWQAIGEEGKANDNATEFANWLETQTDLSQEQADILKDQLAYYTMVRGNPTRYETLREAGFGADQALDLYYEIGTMNTYTSDGVSGGKKAKVVAHINSLNLTPQQKDYLYLDIMGYSQSGLADTPWH